MGVIIFGIIYFVTVRIYLIMVGLAVDDRARAFKALSPGMLPRLASSLVFWSALSRFRFGMILVGLRRRLPVRPALSWPSFS
jgi:hypothetical protein